jgi:hypothetical protein
LARLSKVELDYAIDLSARIGAPEGPGWIPVAGLASDDALLEEILAGGYGAEDRAYAGTALVRGTLWRLLTSTVAAFLTERRVPDLAARNVYLRFGESGFAEGLAFASPAFAALPDDPASSHPDALVLSAEEALLGWMIARLADDHLPPLFEALRRRGLRRGRRAMWGVSADAVADAFLFVGGWLGHREEGMRYGETALAGPSPLSRPANYRVLEYDGGSEITRTRNTCCLYYKVGDGACFTCPRLADEERIRRLEQK